jgi:hypothetical protein
MKSVMHVIQCLLAGAMLLLVFTNHSHADITTGLVGYWRMDETNGNAAFDSVGTRNGNLEPVAGPTLGQPGYAGTAFVFDGVDDRIQITNSTALIPATANFSFFVFVKFNALVTADQWHIFSNNSGQANRANLAVQLSGGTNTFFWFHNGGGSFNFGTQVTTNRWYLLGVCRSNNTFMAWVGTNSFIGYTSTAQISQAQEWRLGTQVNEAARFFKGAMDDARVYNRVLSVSDVAELVDLGRAQIVSQPQNTVADEGSQGSFTVTAQGVAPLSYQWFFGLTPILDATNTSLSISNVSLASAGSYSVVVSNYLGSETSSVATLILGDGTPPVLACPPDLVLTTAVGQCTVTGINLGTPAASDNSGVVYVTSNAPPLYAVGLTLVTWIAKDPSNNTATCSQRVMVKEPSLSLITQQPVSLTNQSGTTTTFITTATSPCITPGFQWFFGTNAILNATNPSLTLMDVWTTDAGSYFVVVSNTAGNVTSEVATLTVITVTNLQNGLVGYWPLDETQGLLASDIAGEHPGILKPATNPPSLGVSGWKGTAYAFSGTNQLIQLTNSAASLVPSNGDFAVFMHTKVPSIGGSGVTNPAQVHLFSNNQFPDVGRANLGLLDTDGGGGPMEVFFFLNGATFTNGGNTGLLISDNQWHLVGLTRRGSNFTAWLDTNGVAMGASGAPVAQLRDWHLGSRVTEDGFFYQGIMDDVRVYNRALRSFEVNELAGSPRLNIVTNPLSQLVEAESQLTLSVTAIGEQPISYQWLLGSQPLAGATNAQLVITNIQLSNAGSYRVVVTNAYEIMTSAAAVVSVYMDTNAPQVLRVMNLGTNTIEILFSEPLASLPATNLANFQLNDITGPLLLGTVSQSPDGRAVRIATPLLEYGKSYRLTLSNLTDSSRHANLLIPNPTQVYFTATPFMLTEIGTTTSNTLFTFDGTNYQMTASGSSLSATNDQLALTTISRTGDFDVQVRVLGLSLADVWARFTLMAREDASGGSRYVAAVATPTLAACFLQYRSTIGGAPQTVGSYPPNFPRLWLRLRRVGSSFAAYAGMDGLNWTPLGTTTITMANTLQVGFGLASGAADNWMTARYTDFTDVTSTAQVALPLGMEPPGPSSRHCPITITEIMYKAPLAPGSNVVEYIELFNSNPFPEEISGWRLTGDIDYTFPSNSFMPPGGFHVVARSLPAMQAVYGGGVSNFFGPYTGTLKVPGTVRLRNEQDAVLLEVNYQAQEPWPVGADGTGHSLVLRRPSLGQQDPAAWASSDQMWGSPGTFDPFTLDALGQVVVNEVFTRSEAPDVDFVELYNRGTATADLGGCTLSDDPTTNKFSIPSGTLLSPGSFISYPQTVLGFGLDAGGERVYLRSPDGKRLLDAVHFGAAGNGISLGRWPDGARAIYPLSTRTPGTNNAAPLNSEIVINEIMYNPISAANRDEFIELYNCGTNPISLAGWKLEEGVRFTFPSNAVIAANGYAVVAENLTNFLAKYPAVNPGIVFGNYSGNLANGGERVTFTRPAIYYETNQFGLVQTNEVGVIMDETSWCSGGQWPKWANNGGSSMELMDARADRRLAANWADSDETTKAAWTLVEATGYLDLGATQGGQPIDRLEVLLQGEGECLVDAVEVSVDGGANLVSNPDFEGDTSGWIFQGSHLRSSWSGDGLGYSSAHALHLRSSFRGDTGANRIYTMLTSELTPGQVCTIRARVRWLKGWPEILFRIEGNYHEATARLLVPAQPGTPGARNSRAATNAPPAIYEVAHAPVVPDAGQPVVVTARVADPDGVASLELLYRIDPATSLVAAVMNDNGTGGDAVAHDGIYSATIPGQAAGTLIGWSIRAVDQTATALNGVYPAGAPAREALVRFGDPTPASSFGTYRFWITPSNADALYTRPNTANEPVEGTYVIGNFRAIHHAEFIYGGSPFKNEDQGHPVTGPGRFAVDVPADDRFLGDASLGKLHAPGNNPFTEDTIQREQYMLWMARQLGQPWLNRRYFVWLVNGNRHGTLMEDTEYPNNDFIESRFPDDPDGDLRKVSFWFEFDELNVGIGPILNKVATHTTLNDFYTTNVVTGQRERKLARCRWHWAPRGYSSTANDFTNVFALVAAAGASNSPTYTADFARLANLKSWARQVAVDHASGSQDAFGFRSGQNAYFYRTDRLPWVYIAWDRNFGLGSNSGTNIAPFDLFEGPATIPDPVFQTVQAQPLFRRAWWSAYQEIAERVWRPETVNAFFDPRYAAFKASGINVVSPDTVIKSWIATRRVYIQQQLAKVTTGFRVTTPGGQSVTNGTYTLTGFAPVNVNTIEVNGRPLALQWSTVTNWMGDFLLASGINALHVVARDAQGAVVSNATLNVTFTGTSAWPAVRINEWMADNAGFMRDPADNDAEDWFELYNTTTNLVDLAGWALSDTLTNQAQYIVPTGYLIPPQGCLLVWADGEPGQNRSNRVDLHASFKLAQTGESISLWAPDGTLIDAVTFGPQTANFTEGRIPGQSNGVVLMTPTPGTTNAAPAPAPAVASLNKVGNQFALTLQSIPGFSYQLQFRDMLSQTNWLDLGLPVPASGSALTVPDGHATNDQRFYRVLRIP